MGTILDVNTRHYAGEHGELSIRAVLVAGGCGDYACYVGQGDAEWIARNGDKVTFEEACRQFPGANLQDAKYRR